MKAVLFPIAILSSLTLVTACGGGKSSSSSKKDSTSKPTTAVSYAQKNKDRCITDQKKINEILEKKKDVIISDGCLSNTSNIDKTIYLTDVGMTMRVDFAEPSSDDEDLNELLEMAYEDDDLSSEGVTLKEFKENAKVSLHISEKSSKIKFKFPPKQPSRDFEVIKPAVAGTYDISATIKVDFKSDEHTSSQSYGNDKAFTIIVK